MNFGKLLRNCILLMMWWYTTAPLFGVSPAWGEIIINEVMADPARDWDGDGAVDVKGDEWIELLNTGSDPVNIGEWWLRDIANETPDLQLSGVLDPGETAVFYGSDAIAWQAANHLTTSGFSLNNTGDFVQLLRSIPGTAGPELELMFAISYDDHEADDDRSCGFDTDQVEWLLFDALNPYGGSAEPAGTGCAPSPGAPNLCHGQVTVQSAAFGEVKATYR